MNDETIDAVAELLISRGPDSPQQYQAIAGEIVTMVRRLEHVETGDPEKEAQTVSLEHLRMEITALCPHCLHHEPCRKHRSLFEESL